MVTMGTASASPSVTWNSPAEGTTFNVGTLVAPTGTASGTAGAGLDLALVLDASGSMRSNATAGGITQSRQQWQADAAIALVNSLPTDGVSVAVVQYTSVGSVRIPLTPTTSAQDIIDAINAVPASGGTAIHNGINTAIPELLTSPNATAGRAKQMVVISDGGSSLSAAITAATSANSQGITVHGVVIPGGNINTMQNIATNGGGIFANFSDPNDLANIEAAFAGGGLFAGLDRLDITLPDGTLIEDFATDAFGNFTINPAWAIFDGANEFIATAYFTNQDVISATLTLFGTDNGVPPPPANGVPTPGVGVLFLGGLGLLGLSRRFRMR